jgi:hypothetical protein
MIDRFPLLIDAAARRRHPDWPVSIPLKLIALHEAQAQANHGQTLRGLAERGGLSPLECLAVLTDVEYRAVEHMTEDAAITEILKRGGITRKA